MKEVDCVARGRAKFGTRFKPTAKEATRRKKSAQSTKKAVKNVFAATSAVSRELRKPRAAKATSRPAKKAAPIPILQAEAARALPKQEEPSVTPSGVRFVGAILIFVGLLICILLWPVGMVVVAYGVYHIVRARKIAERELEKIEQRNTALQSGEDL